MARRGKVIDLELIGAKELRRTLGELPGKVRRKVIRPALSAAATPVVKEARRSAPTESKTLRKSIAKKVKMYKSGDGAAIVGPRRDAEGSYKGKVRAPRRYAHLAENGHIDAKGNYVPGQPFIAPAQKKKGGEAMRILRVKLATGLAKEAKRNA